MPSEADTCRKFIVPKLQEAGWDTAPHSIAEQRYLTAGRIFVRGSKAERKRGKRADYLRRAEIVQQLAERGIHFQQVALQAGKPDADPFDLLCHLAFNAPVLTRRQRAKRVKQRQAAFFARFAREARGILNDLLDKYAADGELQFTLPYVLKLTPISQHGNVQEIVGIFGGPDRLRNAVNQLQSLLYAA